MAVIEQTVLILLVILFLGLIGPEFFKKLRLPFVTALIIIGSLIGPHGFDYLQSNEVIEFFGFLGSAFLMLMVGLEAKISHFKNLQKKVLWMAAINGLVPFAVGVTIVKLFGYGWLPAFLIGTVFISSSIAIIVGSVKGTKLWGSQIGQTIIAAAILMDVASLFLLAVVLQGVAPITKFPLPIYFGILVFSVVVLKMFLPEFATYFLKKTRGQKENEGELRFVIVALMATLLYFSGLGVHPIVAAFVVGLLLSDVIRSEVLYSKLHTIGYGLFVPVFFFIVGMGMNLKLLLDFDYKNLIMIAIIVGLIGSKYVSGYIAGRIAKFPKKHASLFGIGTTAQLTTTLAATYAGSTLGILDQTLTTSIIILSVITTILVPVGLHALASKTRVRRRA